MSVEKSIYLVCPSGSLQLVSIATIVSFRSYCNSHRIDMMNIVYCVIIFFGVLVGLVDTNVWFVLCAKCLLVSALINY